MKVERMTKIKVPASHNKSGYIMRYFCPRCGGDMEKMELGVEGFKGDYQCVICGYEENIVHYKKRRG
jgi:Zn ribbon nucleic-acid-binding protein